MPNNLGILLLSIWLILHGASALFRIPLPFMGSLTSVLALVAGILILIDIL